MTAVGSGLRTAVEPIDEGRAVLLAIGGEVDQAAVERLDWAFAEGLGTATRAGASLVVADLGEVEYFASVGMTALLHAHERAARSGVELVVVAPARHLVTTLLVMTGLDSVVRLVHSVDAALAGRG
ncbi:STAS domain-containing protein [Saccharothrix lopnurensis]|uniref:STAS domain-containing protein n=1 Tax=Saccharothrix lopnurensis TaxID=1670621 RepID=A0ABW1PFU0_9PSEU